MVLAIDFQEPPSKVAAWVQSSGVTFPVLIDQDGAVTQAYEVTATPTVFLVGRDGRIVGKALGTKAWNSDTGRALLTALTRS